MRELSLEIPERYREHLKIGTCSWKYDSWEGLVYRPGASRDAFDYLPEYARLFNGVEVDQWFWSLFPPGPKLPDEDTVRRYAESVPDDFLFTVKVPNSITLTHFYSRQPKAYSDFANRPNPHFLSAELTEEFLKALAPMGEKLGPLMFQFEYLNRRKMPSQGAFLEHLGAFLDAAPKGYRYAIETRNPNYLDQRFFDFLGECGLGMVYLDGYYMPPIGEVFDRLDTSPAAFTVIRLHGPDREGAEKITGSVWNRIQLPKPEGLKAAARIVDASVARAYQVFVNANNHYEGCAPLTLERFLLVLRGEEPDGTAPAETS